MMAMVSNLSFICSLLFISAYVVDATRSCTASCQPLPIHGFVSLARSDFETSAAELREPSSVPGSTNSFRFLSFNAPNLLRIETNSKNSVRIPTRDEIWDIVCSIQQMGGKVGSGSTAYLNWLNLLLKMMWLYRSAATVFCARVTEPVLNSGCSSLLLVLRKRPGQAHRVLGKRITAGIQRDVVPSY